MDLHFKQEDKWCCDGARVANPEGLLSEVTRQSQALDDLCRKLLTVISLLNG